MSTGKRTQPEESGDYYKSYAAKKVKAAIPESFPDPHTYQETIRYSYEDEFEQYAVEIRQKDKWYSKVNDEKILAKWKEEITNKGHGWMWDRLLDELRYVASLKDGDIEPAPIDRVWLSYKMPEELHNKFVDLVASRLETKPKEYHPYSFDTVVDLVHPALYCYVHGKTRVAEEQNHSQLTTREEWKQFCQSGKPEENPTLEESLKVIEAAKKLEASGNTKVKLTEEESDEEDQEGDEDVESRKLKFDPALLFTAHTPIDAYDPDESDIRTNADKKKLTNHLAGIYRWLPADVSVDMYGKVTFRSYINGLHPFEEQELYPVIAEIMNHFIPLWGNVLVDVNIDPPPHAVDRLDFSRRDEEDKYAGVSVDTLEEEYEELLEAAKEKYKDDFDLNKFHVSFFNRLETPERPPPVELARAELQVIVKIASIELTPENPTYTGNWHIEGVPEEAILSTGIYYFAEENIAPNYLQFRIAHGDPDETEMQCPMGLGFGSSMSRNLGKVQTKQGMLLTFPNIMQHCLEGVTLEDKTKPGFRKILVFFLVDPNKRVISSGRVPPPSKEWAEKEGLPTDDDSHFQTLEQARENRANLMFTRKFYVVSQNENVFERECTFCEH